MLKKLLSILLLFIFSLNITGIFLAFKIEQAYIRKTIKKQIKAGVSKEKLHYFKFSTEEYENLHWKRPEIEFKIGKNMYDVVRSEKTDDSVFLFCVNDVEETLLFAKLDERLKEKLNTAANTKDSPLRKMNNILKLVYITNENNLNFDVIFSQKSSRNLEIETMYSDPFIENFSPPPDIA